MRACSMGHPKAVEWLLSRGAEANAEDKQVGLPQHQSLLFFFLLVSQSGI